MAYGGVGRHGTATQTKVFYGSPSDATLACENALGTATEKKKKIADERKKKRDGSTSDEQPTTKQRQRNRDCNHVKEKRKNKVQRRRARASEIKGRGLRGLTAPMAKRQSDTTSPHPTAKQSPRRERERAWETKRETSDETPRAPCRKVLEGV